MRFIAVTAAIITLGAGAYMFIDYGGPSEAELAYNAASEGASAPLPTGGGPMVDVDSLSTEAKRGRLTFNGVCATCHGRDGLGGPAGPPLIHKIYEPSHHGDGAFYLAVQNGVRQHHWDFGNMPAQKGVSRSQVDQIIAYVREAQRQNGIN